MMLHDIYLNILKMSEKHFINAKAGGGVKSNIAIFLTKYLNVDAATTL